MEEALVKPRVLFLEDDKSLSSLFALRMQAEGIEVMQVYDGENAFEETRKFLPDLVLCDLMMPGVSGFDVIDILRNTPETGNVKIVVMSALSQEDDIQKAKALGADDFLVKSQLSMGDVMDRLRAHLGMGPSPIKTTD